MKTGKLTYALTFIAGVFLTGSAPAQSLITPDEFLDAAVGKTLTFELFGQDTLVGTEQFLSRDLSVWKHRERGCVYGQISTDSGLLCFLYDDDADGQPTCWQPFRDGERLFVRLARIFNSEIQEVTRISQSPLDCPSTPMS